jgi:hypothetical protein
MPQLIAVHLWPAMRFDLTDSAEHLGAVGNKYRVAYLDRFAPDVVLA